MSEKVYPDSDFGEVRLRRRPGSRRITVRVKYPEGVRITVPFNTSGDRGLEFFESVRQRLKISYDRQKENYLSAVRELAPIPHDLESEALRAFVVKEYRDKARKELPQRVSTLANEYGFKYNRLRIKHNRSNWGSCSAKGNINLNLNLVRLPQVLQDYVILHELCHLKHADHGAKFHELLESLCQSWLDTLAGSGDTDAVRFSDIAVKRKVPVHTVLQRELKRIMLI